MENKNNYDRISVTQLERFVLCPKMYWYDLNNPQDNFDNSILNIGTIFHMAVQSPELAELFIDSKSTFNVKDKNIAKELIKHAARFERADAYEVRCEELIDDIILTGHLDEVKIKDAFGEKYLEIVDNKTSKTKWTEEDYKNHLQRFMYSYLMYLSTGISEIYFTYRVFQKKSIVTERDITEITEKIDIKEAEYLTKQYLYNYKQSKITNTFEGNRGNQCFWCAYRDICPTGYKKKSKIQKEIEKQNGTFDVDFGEDIDNRTDTAKEFNLPF